CNVCVRTLPVTQPLFNEPLKVLPASVHCLKVSSIFTPLSVWRALPVLNRASWNTLPPIPALTTEFQSCNLTLFAAIACDNWYIAVDACAELDPESAARLAIPLIDSVDVFRSTPAAVKVPMFLVISEKLYTVLFA